MKTKIGELIRHSDFTPVDRYARMTIGEYVLDLLECWNIHPDNQGCVEITEAQIHLVELFIQKFQILEDYRLTNDDLAPEEYLAIVEADLYNPWDLDSMDRLIALLEAKVQKNKAPKGPLLPDGWNDVDGLKVWCQHGQALLAAKQGETGRLKYAPYRWSSHQNKYVLCTPHATLADIANVAWR